MNQYPYYQTAYYQNNNQNQIIPVPSETDARNYPVANGNSVTFRDENAPYIYVKSMGYSQLGRPVFEKYRLTKEEIEEPSEQKLEYALKSEMESLKEEINHLKKKLVKEDSHDTK